MHRIHTDNALKQSQPVRSHRFRRLAVYFYLCRSSAYISTEISPIFCYHKSILWNWCQWICRTLNEPPYLVHVSKKKPLKVNWKDIWYKKFITLRWLFSCVLFSLFFLQKCGKFKIFINEFENWVETITAMWII